LPKNETAFFAVVGVSLRREESVAITPYVEQGCQMVFFHTKKTLWAYFGGIWNLKCWYILWPFGILYGHLVYYMANW
jgi:hypothetical protein